MKSYSFVLVERKSGPGGLKVLFTLTVLGAGAYYAYHKLTDEKKFEEFSDTSTTSGVNTPDLEASKGEDFAKRVLKAAKRIVD